MRGRRRCCALLIVSGCGRVAFDPQNDSGAPQADACTLGPWSAPMLAPGLASDLPDSGGQVTPDGLGLYYAQNNKLHVARRPDRSSAWTTALIEELDLGSNQYDASVTADELEIFFTRSEGGNAVCLYYASRTSTAMAWSIPVRLDELCTTRDAGGAYVTPDGLTLLYTPVYSGEGTIFVTTRPDRSTRFPAGTLVDGLPGLTAGTYGYGAMSADQLTLYFEGDSPLDLFSATRASIGEPWSAPVPLSTINSGYTEEDVSVTADGRELYFDSDRPAAQMDENIYVVTRDCI
ncbi:MAG: hypothetical protein HOV81_30800 [Kofleriaceae bacterium]|nr:hypothetical protein [Kofleriaceae bacterium]